MERGATVMVVLQIPYHVLSSKTNASRISVII